MSFQAMWQEMLGIPGMNFALSQTKINEGLQDVYDDQLWSFQLQTGGWLTPGLIAPQTGSTLSVGAITISPFTTQLVGNAAASAAWLSLIGQPFLTSLQIRIPYYSLYNIIAVNSSVPTAVVLTLDRPWMEPAQVNSSYMMYQAYFPVPVSDFKKFTWARDTTNNSPMDYWSYSQADLAVIDAQRTDFNQPSFLVPYQTDQRPGSATFGNMLYELWPHPLSQLPYTFGYLRTGAPLVYPSDTVPYPLTEDLVKLKAYSKLYMWKESQKGDEKQRGAGANWMGLAAAAEKLYQEKKKQISLKDQMLVNLYFTRFKRNMVYNNQPYATITGQLNVGRF